MKIPYIKIPIADIAAYIAPFSAEEKGLIFQAVLNFGLYQKWDELVLPESAQIGYSNVKEIVENEIKNYKKFCKEQKQKIKNHWEKIKNTDDTNVLPQRNNQTKTKTKQEAEYINKILTASNAAGTQKPKSKPKNLNDLQKFSNAVIENFEPDLKSDTEVAIWFKRNCRCLSDILNFCGKNIPLAVKTIDVCLERMEKAKIQGVGYEAVCRNLPFYREEAKKRLGGAYA